MCADVNSKAADLAKFIEQMSPEERDQIAANDYRLSEIEHQEFATAFQLGDCYICGDKISDFNKKRPCIHWLLKPKGFKKKNFRAVADHFGVFQIQSYLRWVANQQSFAKHINDLPSEEAKVLELTIRYEKLEWSFSCSESDLKGHGTTQHSKYPHYHFQMRVNQFILLPLKLRPPLRHGPEWTEEVARWQLMQPNRLNGGRPNGVWRSS